MALFIKIATGIIVLLYIFAVNRYKPKTIKKSLKSPLKNDFSAFGNVKAQLTTKEVLKLLGYEMSLKEKAILESYKPKAGEFHEAIKNKTKSHENHPFNPTTTDPNLPTDTEVDPKFKP